MMACPSTRSEVWGALANVLASYLSTPRQFFGPVIKVHPLPSGEAERRIVAYGLMQSAKNTCITIFRGGGGGESKARTAWRFHHLHSSNNAGECVLLKEQPRYCWSGIDMGQVVSLPTACNRRPVRVSNYVVSSLKMPVPHNSLKPRTI